MRNSRSACRPKSHRPQSQGRLGRQRNEPDVKVAGPKHLKTAHMLALEKNCWLVIPPAHAAPRWEQAKEAVSHYR